MTARNDELGQQKYNELCEKYPEDKERFFYHQLDITNEESITYDGPPRRNAVRRQGTACV